MNASAVHAEQRETGAEAGETHSQTRAGECAASAPQQQRDVLLSVVVTIVDGGQRLERCLRALTEQEGVGPIEILVPYDDTVRGIAEISTRFPTVEFLALGKLPTRRAAASAGGQHELFDRRRAAGLAAARGELVAVLEDRGAPRRDWARAVTAAHAGKEVVVGGAIENSNNALLNRAVYLCDFGKYQLPFGKRVSAYVSDTNVCYKRAALESTRELWQERYHETTVHWALRRAGESLLLAPEMVVEQDRGKLRLAALLPERIQHGRLFAYTRARELSAAQRVLRIITAPALPLVLFARIARGQWRRPTFGAFVRAAPVIALLLAAWSAGEAVGYITGKP